MTKADWAKIMAAKEVLGLGDAASLPEIKRAFRLLAKKYHPDLKNAAAGEPPPRGKMLEVNAAYQTLLDYCAAFRFPLRPAAPEAMTATDWWLDRFGQDPLWGPGPGKKD